MIGSQTINGSYRAPFSLMGLFRQLVIWFLSAHAFIIACSSLGVPRQLLKQAMIAIFLLNALRIAFQALAFESSVWKSNFAPENLMYLHPT